MSKQCDCCRACRVMVESGEDYPSVELLHRLRPVMGILVDLARDYDDCAMPDVLTTAKEFVLWLQQDVYREKDKSPVNVQRSSQNTGEAA